MATARRMKKPSAGSARTHGAYHVRASPASPPATRMIMAYTATHDHDEAETESDDAGAGARHEVTDALFEEVLASVPHGPLVSVHPRTSVAETIRAMNQQHTGCAVVADEVTGELVGIFTERDVLTRVAVRRLD